MQTTRSILPSRRGAFPWRVRRLFLAVIPATTAALIASQAYEAEAAPTSAPSDGSWTSFTFPVRRIGPSAIYDPVRRRLVLFGGNDGALHNDVWVLPLDGLPVWTQLQTNGSP